MFFSHTSEAMTWSQSALNDLVLAAIDSGMASGLQSRQHLCGGVDEQLHIGLVAEAAVAFLACHLAQDA